MRRLTCTIFAAPQTVRTAGAPVELGDEAARLERHRGVTLAADLFLDDQVRGRERGRHVAVARRANSAARFPSRLEQRPAAPARARARASSSARQRLVVDLDLRRARPPPRSGLSATTTATGSPE